VIVGSARPDVTRGERGKGNEETEYDLGKRETDHGPAESIQIGQERVTVL
jgi:hypothetical protein